MQEPPATVADRSSKEKPKETKVPFYLPVLEPPELEYTYEDVKVKVPEEDQRYTALSSITADKASSSQYTSLIKTHSQAVRGSGGQPGDILFNKTQSAQKTGTSEEIEPYDYVSFENNTSPAKSVNGDLTSSTSLAQNQDEIYY